MPGLLPAGLVEGAVGLLGEVEGGKPEVDVGLLVVLLPPVLLGQGGDGRGEVGVVVHVDDVHLAVCDLQQGHGGVVAVAHFVHLLRGVAVPQEGGQGVADQGAVGKDRHRLVGMLGGDVQNGRGAPAADLGESLPPRGVEVRGAGGEEGHLLVVGPVDAGPGAVLPLAHAHLPQVGPGLEGQALGHIDGPGGGHGAEQVAGVDRVYGGVGEALLQRLDLPVPVVGDEAVVLAVDAAVEVALCLGVSDEIKCGHAFASRVEIIKSNTLL